MFRVAIALPSNGLTGLPALQLRERLQLPPNSHFVPKPSGHMRRWLDNQESEEHIPHFGYCTKASGPVIEAPVGEEFVRQHFAPFAEHEECITYQLSLDDLEPGDVAETGHSTEKGNFVNQLHVMTGFEPHEPAIGFPAGLDPARILALWMKVHERAMVAFEKARQSQAEREARIKAERERWANEAEERRRPAPPPKPMEITRTDAIRLGAMESVPVYESHKRGTNWLAVITEDPSKPGGLERRFLERAKGDFYYMVAGLHEGDAVEFGADYSSGGGRKSEKRWYGVVTELTDDAVTFKQYPSGPEACQAAHAFQLADADGGDIEPV